MKLCRELLLRSRPRSHALDGVRWPSPPSLRDSAPDCVPLCFRVRLGPSAELADTFPAFRTKHDFVELPVLNLVLAYSIEYEILGLGDRPGSAGVAEVSGPASAPSPAGSGAIRGCRLLRRQWPSAPPVALQSGKFRRPADFR
jgi:hypothetical protein